MAPAPMTIASYGVRPADMVAAGLYRNFSLPLPHGGVSLRSQATTPAERTMTRIPTAFAAFLAATLVLSPAALGAIGYLASALRFDRARPRLDPRARELAGELTPTNVSTASSSAPFRAILEDL